ncbi:MAG TPA: hypothetical protein VFX30_08110 [bacterium]|nr:hypothetical protein [bacterium]
MAAMPAEKWSVSDAEVREIEEQTQLDLLIETVAYYRELASEYPTTAFYRRMLETAEKSLRDAEKEALARWSAATKS